MLTQFSIVRLIRSQVLHLQAFDPSTGQPIWTSDISQAMPYASEPYHISEDASRIVLGMDGRKARRKLKCKTLTMALPKYYQDLRS